MAGDKLLQWVEKYRPQTLGQVKGNDKAVAAIRAWAKSWELGEPPKKGLILVGGHGTGKTSAALALATENNWGVLELNASDARNNDNIRRIALTGSLNETFTATGEFVSARLGGRKLIILDEADNLFERIGRTSPDEKPENDLSDRGGKNAIIETLRKTRQPIILIVNDLYELTRDSGAAINHLSEVVKFTKLRQPTIKQILKQICDQEGVEITPDVLEELSRHANGDMRSAINDLQLLAEGNTKITFDQLKVVGFRNVKTSIFDALRIILHTTQADRARESVWDLDESPEDIILWLDENLPLEYRRPYDLMRGFKVLSKADVYLGRISRRQYYGLWAYAKDLMTVGLALAKTEGYHGWVNYQFPTWLLQMSRTKELRQLQKSIAQKIGRYCHTSREVVSQDVLPYFRHIYRSDHAFAVNMSIELAFAKEEISWLLDEKITGYKVKHLLTEIKNTIERSDHKPRTEASAATGISAADDIYKYPVQQKSTKKSTKTEQTEQNEPKDQKLLKDQKQPEPGTAQEKIENQEKIETNNASDTKEPEKKKQKKLIDF